MVNISTKSKFFNKIKFKITKFVYRKEITKNKFKIGDIVVPTIDESTTLFFYNEGETGEIIDIYIGYQFDSKLRWYYVVQFINSYSEKKDEKFKLSLNEYDIKLDMSYIREKKLKQIGI